MKELLYTVLELEEWNKNSTCCFCYNKSVCQIRTRSKITHEIIANDEACENCKEKFENDELEKCERCGRLKNRHSYVCHCIADNENIDEKELPILPHEERESTFYERQINSLQEKLNEAEWTINEEREAHEDFMEKSEEWGKRQKQELLDRIKELEAENKRLKELTPQELIDELNYCREKTKNLEAQLEQLTSQQVAQIEVKEPKKWPWLRVKK
jgi:hypothetical protein